MQLTEEQVNAILDPDYLKSCRRTPAEDEEFRARHALNDLVPDEIIPPAQRYARACEHEEFGHDQH